MHRKLLEMIEVPPKMAVCLWQRPISGVWECFYDGFICRRRGLCGVADTEAVIRPVEFRST